MSPQGDVIFPVPASFCPGNETDPCKSPPKRHVQARVDVDVLTVKKDQVPS